MEDITIEQVGSKDYGPCPCCGNLSRSVWGYAFREDAIIAAYFVHWTLGRPDHGANFDFIIGTWGNETAENDRQAVSLEFRLIENSPQFMVIDAKDRPVAESELVKTVLSRADVIGTPIAQEVFDLVDAVWLHDERISELYGE